MPITGQFINSTCIRTNQSSEDIRYSAVLTERIRRQRRNTRTIGQQRSFLKNDTVILVARFNTDVRCTEHNTSVEIGNGTS